MSVIKGFPGDSFDYDRFKEPPKKQTIEAPADSSKLEGSESVQNLDKGEQASEAANARQASDASDVNVIDTEAGLPDPASLVFGIPSTKQSDSLQSVQSLSLTDIDGDDLESTEIEALSNEVLNEFAFEAIGKALSRDPIPEIQMLAAIFDQDMNEMRELFSNSAPETRLQA